MARQHILSPLKAGIPYLSSKNWFPNFIIGGTPMEVPPTTAHPRPPLPVLANSSFTIISWNYY